MSWAKEVERLGAGEIVLTSMDADGTCDGYDLPVTAAVSEAVSIPVVASGGAGNPQHLADAILKGKADAALAASIFHFGQFTIAETKQVMRDAGIPVRLANEKVIARARSGPAAQNHVHWPIACAPGCPSGGSRLHHCALIPLGSETSFRSAASWYSPHS